MPILWGLSRDNGKMATTGFRVYGLVIELWVIEFKFASLMFVTLGFRSQIPPAGPYSMA